MPERTGATAAYLMAPEAFDFVYGPEERAAIAARMRIGDRLIAPQDYAASAETWPEVEVLFSGWGMVPMDEAFFARFPKLKVVFYAAGTVKGFVTDLFWRRRLRVTNAAAANAVPVCEFTVAQIVLALKQTWRYALHIRRHGQFPPCPIPAGNFRTTVGLVSLGKIGSLVAERLRQFDLNVVAYDPCVAAEEEARLGVRLLSLDEVFAQADVVSCHAPLLPETERMIRGRHFEAMKPGATFINTARGAVVAEGEMIAALRARPDLFAVLDVTDPLPPEAGSPLYALDNVLLTPHIAGSLGNECRRMGKLMVEELDRFLAGQPLHHEISEAAFHAMA